MRIDWLEVKNFRAFGSQTFHFSKQFNLLVGENGAGKTSALEAISVAAGSWFLGLRGYDTRHIWPSEVRLAPYGQSGALNFEEQYPVEVHAGGCVLDNNIEWSRSLSAPGGRTSYGTASQIKQLASRADSAVRSGDEITLPLISYYGTGRLWQEPRLARQASRVKAAQVTEDKRRLSRLEGYRNSVDPRLSVRELVRWIAVQSWMSFQFQRDSDLFATVKRAIVSCVDGATNLYFDPGRGEVILELESGIAQPFMNLSDGQRSVLAMVGDIAQKAAKLNPHLGPEAVRKTPGVVLIDELDLHLHPRWQRKVVNDLRTTFESIQFFATTHSPQIIGEVPPEEIQLLSVGSAPRQLSESLGRESGWILRHIMGTPERSRFLRDGLASISDLIEAGEFEQAREKILEFRKTYGNDPELVELEASISRWEIDE